MRDITPRDIRLLNALAALQLSSGRPSAALPFLHLSRSLSPKEPRTCALLAQAYLRMGQTAQSAEFFRLYEEIQTGPVPARIHILKSLILLHLGQLAAARGLFMKVLKMGADKIGLRF